MLKRHRDKATNIYGSGDFAARLAAREAALGLSVATGLDVADVVDVTPPVEPNPAPALQSAVDDDDMPTVQRDRWGNEVISGDANEDGTPHIIRSLWDGRLIRVCGEYRSGKHNIWWTFDEHEMRPICSLCWGWQTKQHEKKGR